jgi:hypothetical protein
MKHISFANKSLLVGDDLAYVLLDYWALLAERADADIVEVRVLNTEGIVSSETVPLEAAVPLRVEPASLPFCEPDNADALAYLRRRIWSMTSPPWALPQPTSLSHYYEAFNL